MADGLPDLPSGVNIFSDIALLTADLVSLPSTSQAQWGIYLDGTPVVVADNVMTFGFRKSARLSKYPQEQGAFATYNKVVLPGEPKIKYSTGGSLADRTVFLASIEPLIQDTNLYDVVTPEATYQSYNVINYDYPRAADSAGLIEVDVWLEEVVVVGSSVLSDTTAPGDQSQVNNGLVQPGSSSMSNVTITPVQ
jgi:hypothetical protein